MSCIRVLIRAAKMEIPGGCMPSTSRCSFPAGGSPVSVSTGAPSSRPQARREIYHIMTLAPGSILGP